MYVQVIQAMLKIVQLKATALVAIFICLDLLVCFSVPVEAGEIVVILNKSNKTAILSLRDLRQIYQGRKKIWDGGEPITLFLPVPRSQAMKSLAQYVFNVDGAAAVSMFYLKSVFQEKFNSPPISTDNSVAEVAGTPGGIAIIDTSEAGDTSSVKVIKVGGL